MGDPRRIRSEIVKPKQPWDKERIAMELELVGEFGLRSKRELYLAASILRKMRRTARSYLALPPEERSTKEKELIRRLYKLSLVNEDATLDDVLSLTLRSVLSRRLQSIVFAKGLAKSLHHARQLIVHGKIKIGEEIVRAPGRIVTREEENKISLA
ncbi:MAG: 30S ribosomal protein S4 [Thermoproteota archaeon]|nr:30S ribosomal protein S4 [Candidatus Brockarchaeota archaeon]MBO3768737.1 30S ribosomal protein S4 [Candidatus Brockarchaeota archaeon]MBO3801035.1 30S ribosomal protein S4 [Candidatus Brockarchaeota archaeon]